MSQVSLKARIKLDDPSKIGKYICNAQDAAGNSGSAILTMQERVLNHHFRIIHLDVSDNISDMNA